MHTCDGMRREDDESLGSGGNPERRGRVRGRGRGIRITRPGMSHRSLVPFPFGRWRVRGPAPIRGTPAP